MSEVRRKLPDIKTPEYNAVWSACLDVLTREDSKLADAIRFPEGGGMFIRRAR